MTDDNQDFNFDKTALESQLNILQLEYEKEILRKESFENRAGVLLGFLSTFTVMLLEIYPLDTIILPFKQFDTRVLDVHLKSILGLAMYIFLIKSIFGFMNVLKKEEYDNVNIVELRKRLERHGDDDKILEYTHNIKHYANIITSRQNITNNKANRFEGALNDMRIVIVLIVLFNVF